MEYRFHIDMENIIEKVARDKRLKEGLSLPFPKNQERYEALCDQIAHDLRAYLDHGSLTIAVDGMGGVRLVPKEEK